MKQYCRAYYLRDLRQYDAWTEKQAENEEPLTDDAIVYLWDDFTVVRSPVIPDRGVVFDAVTPEWQQFCETSLRFAIPEDLRFAYEQDKTLDATPEAPAAQSESPV